MPDFLAKLRECGKEAKMKDFDYGMVDTYDKGRWQTNIHGHIRNIYTNCSVYKLSVL